jgi:hypothetical protein
MRIDNSLREASNDSERLAMCRLATLIKNGLFQQAPDMAETSMAMMSLEANMNKVDVNLMHFGDFEIIVRKK